MCPYYKLDTAEKQDMMGNETGMTRYTRFLIEKRKLDAMVYKFFCDGNDNLAKDARILAQSRVVDDLLAEEMLH